METAVQDESAPRPPALAPSSTFTPIRFRTPEEFRSRPAWRDGLDHLAHKLYRIIGDYGFTKAEEMPCGLKHCRTKHWNGYVVETVDGLETHIGRDCGKTFFHVNWGDVQAVFSRAAEERDISQWLSSMVQQRDAMSAQANALYAVLANHTDEVRQVLERIEKEPQVTAALLQVVRTGGTIQVEREIDEDTAEARGLRRDQRHYLETVGRIFGLEALQPARRTGTLKGDDLLEQLRVQVIAVLPHFSAGSLKALNARQRKDRVKQLETIKAVLADAEQHLTATRRFLVPTNLRELAKLPVHRPNERARRILQRFGSLPDSKE